ncbi:MAG: cation:dicarboxylate symporter family transporter, partial [Burkholderiales bacterium]
MNIRGQGEASRLSYRWRWSRCQRVGISSAGMVTMVMVLQAVGLPAEAIAILLPIDRLLDT